MERGVFFYTVFILLLMLNLSCNKDSLLPLIEGHEDAGENLGKNGDLFNSQHTISPVSETQKGQIYQTMVEEWGRELMDQVQKHYGWVSWSKSMVDEGENGFIAALPLMKEERVKAVVQYFFLDGKATLDFRSRENIEEVIQNLEGDEEFADVWFNVIAKFHFFQMYTDEDTRLTDAWLSEYVERFNRGKRNFRNCTTETVWYQYIEYCGGAPCALVAGYYTVSVCTVPSFAPIDPVNPDGGGGGSGGGVGGSGDGIGNCVCNSYFLKVPLRTQRHLTKLGAAGTSFWELVLTQLNCTTGNYVAEIDAYHKSYGWEVNSKEKFREIRKFPRKNSNGEICSYEVEYHVSVNYTLSGMGNYSDSFQQFGEFIIN
ncbi:MAG TPA: hypothetical protein PKC30_01695 [Saprospiraceae bacterium]|nr:hypothetical protein [Saprospiraceae bacterium]